MPTNMINKDCTYGVLEELAETGKLIMAQLKIRFTRSWSKANPCAPRCFHYVPGRLPGIVKDDFRLNVEDVYVLGT